jgi:hypothetical protein
VDQEGDQEMTFLHVAQYAMWGACVCYTAAAAAFYYGGKPWMTLTMALYAASVITVWMAGDK